MTEPTNTPPTPFDWLLDGFAIFREELTTAHTNGSMTTTTDTLLTAKEAAALMGVSPRWLYRHAAKLPFTRRINRKNLRFSEAGLRRWLATKKPPLTR